MRHTHTYAILQISKSAYDEIKKIIEDGGYSTQIHRDSQDGEVIDMRGLAISIKPEEDPETRGK